MEQSERNIYINGINLPRSIYDYKLLDIEKLIGTALDDFHYLEAFGLADQYVNNILVCTFNEIGFFEKKTLDSLEKNNFIGALAFSVAWLGIDNNYINEYRDFKALRRVVIHEVLNSNIRKLKITYTQRSTKKKIFGFINRFEQLHLILSKSFYEREISPSSAGSAIKRKGYKFNTRWNEIKADIFKEKIKITFNIVYAKLTKEIEEKINNKSLLNNSEEKIKYIVNQIMNYFEGKRKEF